MLQQTYRRFIAHAGLRSPRSDLGSALHRAPLAIRGGKCTWSFTPGVSPSEVIQMAGLPTDIPSRVCAQGRRGRGRRLDPLLVTVLSPGYISILGTVAFCK